ncbi:MAG TPA: hypothetical protein VEJ16_02205 [Alphaproteobacteria bacterium]|nr:hypothetical protein [Alphaproteobacteria bacterium]
MALEIETFSNLTGGNAFFKAIGHPLAAPKIAALLERLKLAGPVAVYDPHSFALGFAALYPPAGLDLVSVYVQNVEHIGQMKFGATAQPVTELPASKAKTLFIVAFDAARAIDHIRHLAPRDMAIVSLDDAKLPREMLSNPRHYLDPLNFATNFAFFRDTDGLHTRLVTANYWAGYGAKEVSLWFMLFDEHGKAIAEWRERPKCGMASISVDSRKVRAQFGLAPFTGQLFVHAIGAAGHDVVKYALDVYGDEADALSCTHDANAWPADFYAGLPAPRKDERVILWIQNSHPCPIPAKAVGLNLMGSPETAWFDRVVSPFASHALDVAELLPHARWPQQLEIQAGKHFVRPRYEIARANGRRRIAHVNVERTDLKSDPRIPELANLLGKGFLLPAPLAPLRQFRLTVLPTPMATCQKTLPVTLLVYDSEGYERARHSFGCLKRSESIALDLGDLIDGGAEFARGYGHVELVYDFAHGGEADGWLHGIFRYEDIASGHAAETSFGAHVFNTVLTYKGEPQSYSGPPPGLSTRLFLRLGPPPLDTLCHLIFPASLPWRAHSATDLILHDGEGQEVARRQVAIPCGGSRFWRYAETFDAGEREHAGSGAYIVVRDGTCRLFGYHGLIGEDGAFSLDHMFGF